MLISALTPGVLAFVVVAVVVGPGAHWVRHRGPECDTLFPPSLQCALGFHNFQPTPFRRIGSVSAEHGIVISHQPTDIAARDRC